MFKPLGRHTPIVSHVVSGRTEGRTEGVRDGVMEGQTEGRARGQLLLYNAASVRHCRFMEAGVSQSAGSDRLIT